ncbi:MAG TPA: flavodoxin family protein, partial [Armatimonadota bacterium]|nr:flavodoxin family protein [Armatimonadota bacterium]
MDVLSILGSPRRAGNTARVLDWVEEVFHEAGSAVERISIGDRDIRPCTGCFACKLQPGSMCIQRDDANELFRQIRDAD